MRKKDEITRITKSQLTAVIVHVEGNDDTLQQGFRTLSEAIAGLAKPSRLFIAKESTQLPAAHAEAPAPDNGDTEAQEVAESQAEAHLQRLGKQRKNVRSPSVLDLDLASTTPSLKQFLEEKHLTDSDPDTKRYLAIAWWLKTHLKLPEISVDHVHTCYRHMGWQTPNNPIQTFRTLKSVDGSFGKGDEKGCYAINHIGENKVQQLGQSKP